MGNVSCFNNYKRESSGQWGLVIRVIKNNNGISIACAIIKSMKLLFRNLVLRRLTKKLKNLPLDDLVI